MREFLLDAPFSVLFSSISLPLLLPSPLPLLSLFPLRLLPLPLLPSEVWIGGRVEEEVDDEVLGEGEEDDGAEVSIVGGARKLIFF